MAVLDRDDRGADSEHSSRKKCGAVGPVLMREEYVEVQLAKEASQPRHRGGEPALGVETSHLYGVGEARKRGVGPLPAVEKHYFHSRVGQGAAQDQDQPRDPAVVEGVNEHPDAPGVTAPTHHDGPVEVVASTSCVRETVTRNFRCFPKSGRAILLSRAYGLNCAGWPTSLS